MFGSIDTIYRGVMLGSPKEQHSEKMDRSFFSHFNVQCSNDDLHISGWQRIHQPKGTQSCDAGTQVVSGISEMCSTEIPIKPLFIKNMFSILG